MRELPPKPTISRIALILLLLAIGGACFLLFVSLRNGPVAGCGPESSCDTVLKSRWAYLLPGIPVTAPALAVYLVLLEGLLCRGGRKNDLRRFRLLLATLLVLAAGVWFIGLQALVIGTFCKWCMGTHLAGMAASLCILIAIRPRSSELLTISAGLAAPAMAAMAACQLLFPQDTTSTTELAGGTTQRQGRSIALGNFRIDLDATPHLGNPDSENTIVLFSDYSCASCRTMHHYLRLADQRFGSDSFLLVILPVPLNPDCNPYLTKAKPEHRDACEYTRHALALWFADREAFRSYHRWINESGPSSQPPGPAEARIKAAELLGREKFSQALEDPRIARRIEENNSLWQFVTSSSGTPLMPKLVVGGKVRSGLPPSADSLCDYLAQALSLPRPADGR